MESMNDEVSVKLTQDQIVERAETMAAKIQHISHLRDKKRRETKAAQELIDSELDEVERLARVITGQEELRKQGELFAGEAGAASCTCESEGVAAIDCPVHGTLPPRAGDDGQAASEGAEAELAEDPGEDPPDDVAAFPAAGDAGGA